MGPKKNPKGKAAGSGTVSATRREKFRQKGLLRENENMGKEDQVVDWEEDRRKGNKKPKLLSEEEVAKFFEPKKDAKKEEDEGPERPATRDLGFQRMGPRPKEKAGGTEKTGGTR